MKRSLCRLEGLLILIFAERFFKMHFEDLFQLEECITEAVEG